MTFRSLFNLGKKWHIDLSRDLLRSILTLGAVFEARDAMTSTRPYRKGLAIDVTLEIMSELRGIQFEGFLVETLCDLVTKNRLGYILGHSNAGRRLAVCPMDGPIMAVPSDKKDGDVIYCHACKGIYRLHIAADTFVLEPTGHRRFDLQPEIDAEPINTMASAAPKRITLGGR